jgi:CheY-like chemotaxis protein
MRAPATVVIAGDDLLFATRLAASVAACGHRPRRAHTAAALRDALAEGASAVILNLASTRMDALAAIRDARADPATRTMPVLGFCGHADLARRDAAKAAGCDLVATNGEVAAHLPRLLTTLLGPSEPAPRP